MAGKLVKINLGGDSGCSSVKLVGDLGYYTIKSNVELAPKRMVEAAKRNRARKNSAFGSEHVKLLKFNELHYVVGPKAEEMETSTSDVSNGAKSNNDALIRTLFSVCEYVDKFHGDIETKKEIIVKMTYGLPIDEWGREGAPEEVASLYLNDGESFDIEFDGHPIAITFADIEVMPEGASAFFAHDASSKDILIVDAGSQTINFTSIVNESIEAERSGQITHGVEFFKDQYGDDAAAVVCAKSIISKIGELKWKTNSTVYIVGGYADKIKDALMSVKGTAKFEYAVLEPTFIKGRSIEKLDPIYANAVGLHTLANMIFNQQKVEA